MSPGILAVAGGALAAMFLTCAGLFTTAFTTSEGPAVAACLPATSAAPAHRSLITTTATTTGSPAPRAATPRIGQWDAEQVANAEVVVTVGATLGVPPRGWVIAMATAMQETRLRNLKNLGEANNRDSRGLFQQRPSQGWGSAAQLQDPAYAATAFYQHLQQVPGWQTLPLTAAAQAVQHSATPTAYARWEPDATALVTAVGSGNSRAISGIGEQCASNCPPTVSTDDHSITGSGCLGGQAVVARAATWLTDWNGGPVPYESSGDPTTWFGGYRRDCSGYASMALGLPGPGLNGRGLAARSVPITRSELRAGDLMINPSPGDAGHVVIFDRWTDASMSSYFGYEQSADGGTHHRVLPWAYFNGYPMSPYRFVF